MLTIAAFGIIALMAVGFLFKKLTAREVVAEAKVPSRSLPMAISEIEAGTVITRAHIGNGPWQAGSDLSPDTFTTAEGVIGRIAKEKITAARPLRGSQFYAPGDLPDLKVSEGMRAVTINVGDETAMVNGLIKPGQFVDVHMTIDGPAAGEQARIMLLAKQKGTIALSYNPTGAGGGGVSVKSEQDRVTLQQLLGIAPIKEKDKPFMTEHFREGMRSTTYFEDGRRVNYSGDNDFGGNDNGGIPLGNRGDNWSTSVDKAQKNQDVTQQPAASSAL
jgi:pilus assembly protein CpaB